MIITVKNLTKTIKKKMILNNISCEFRSGYKYAITGANGSGKTMLLKTISGLIIPTSGEIIIDNLKLHDKFRFYNSLGIIIETTKFYPNLTGFENLKLLASINKKCTDDDIIKTLKKVNLHKNMHEKVKKYSLGMNQRLAIAQAIMEDPQILLLDEPTIALDDTSRDILFQILDEFKSRDKIIIVATNELHDLNSRYDKILKLSEGNLIKSGDANEI